MKVRAMQVAYMFLLLLYGAIVTSCTSASSSSDGQPPPGSISLSGGGSTFSSVLFDRWFAAYHDSHPKTFIKYASVGSGEGVRRFIGKDVGDKDKVEFGASDAAMSDAELAGSIQNSSGSIGYVGFEFARWLRLGMAALEKEGRFVQPSDQSCAAGLATAQFPQNLRVFVPDPSGTESYPIVTFSWVLLRKTYSNPETAMALRELFRWCLQEGQGYASQVGYLPLPVPAVEKSFSGSGQYRRRRIASRLAGGHHEWYETHSFRLC